MCVTAAGHTVEAQTMKLRVATARPQRQQQRRHCGMTDQIVDLGLTQSAITNAAINTGRRLTNNHAPPSTGMHRFQIRPQKAQLALR